MPIGVPVNQTIGIRLRNESGGLSRALRLGFLLFAVAVVDVDRERREGSAAWSGVVNVPAFDLTPKDAV